MKIGELARATGITAKTIRFYEAEGLVPNPLRTSSGYRVYRVEDAERLEFVRKAKRLGLSLEEIRGILQLHERRDPTCAHVRSLLETKLAQVEELLRDLQGFRTELVRLRDQASAMMDCRPTGGRICGIIEASELGLTAKSWARAGQRVAPGK